jgi:hypothetical protein
MVGEMGVCHRTAWEMALERLVTGMAAGLRKAGRTRILPRRRRRESSNRFVFQPPVRPQLSFSSSEEGSRRRELQQRSQPVLPLVII